MRSDDAVLAELRQRVCGSGNVALDPPFSDPARCVSSVVVMKQIADDVSADVVTVEQLADRVESDFLSGDGGPRSVRN